MYKIGDIVWVGNVSTEAKQIPCPVCFAKKVVTLILGDDSHVELDCKFCQRGFGDATGYIPSTYYFVGSAIQKTITGVDTRQDNHETKITYWFGGIGYDKRKIADTKEDAIAKAEVEAIESNLRATIATEERKHHEHKTYSWNAGYYLQRAESSLKDHEAYTKKAKFMQSKARPRKSNAS